MQESSPSKYGSLMQTVAAISSTIAVAAITWLWQTTSVSSERIARMEEQLKVLAQDRYTASDSVRDYRATDARFASAERRLDAIERKLR